MDRAPRVGEVVLNTWNGEHGEIIQVDGTPSENNIIVKIRFVSGYRWTARVLAEDLVESDSNDEHWRWGGMLT